MKLVNAMHRVLILFVVLFGVTMVSAQNSKQKELETRRQELRQEIQKISALQAENKSKHKSELSTVTGLNYKISVLDNLIKVTNQQANLLTRNIDANQKKITDLREELKVLKENYADMIVKSYKSKNDQSRIMFLLSSDNFKQAYKRLQYMKQYTEHQKQQGEEIKAKTTELQQTNASLLKQQEEKRQIIAENRKNQRELQAERNRHQELMKSIQKNLSKYASEIRQKQREANKIDAEIDRIIKAAIAKSNKKAGKSSSTASFALTAEEKVLSANFVSNKGKLPWPVERGYVTVKYGLQPHPLNRSLTIKSNGVRIATQKGADVRAVFSGEVIAIVSLKNMNPFVMVKHGNYITAYKNLSKVFVKEGQMVDTKQTLGKVFTNPANGESILSFIISKDDKTQNPASWIYKM